MGVLSGGAVVLALALGPRAESAEFPPAVSVPMPDGGAGIGFDDLGFAPGLKRLLVPGGRTGRLFLIDPATRKTSSIAGFSASRDYNGGHGDGVTSADEGDRLLFATDRDAKTVSVLDPETKAVVSTAALAGSPDYVRFVAATSEVWVTEPDSERIEIFSLSSAKGRVTLRRAAELPVPGGPEYLLIDGPRGRAYANTWKGESLAIGLKSRKIEARWPNGCEGSRGLALDAAKGWLFVGCEEGKAVVLDAAHDGKVLSSMKAGDGVDIVAYNPRRRHFYLPGAKSATLAILGVADSGELSLAGTVATAKGAHCVAAEAGGAWVCDPDHGRLLYVPDVGK